MNRSTRAVVAGSVLGVVALLGTAPAGAATGSTQGQLSAVNDQDASGQVMVDVRGTTLDVRLQSQGLVADQPHAAHIHFGADARHECPTAADDADGNGTITTTEGGPAYGPVVVSLTKTGDTSPDSGLAVDRFDTAPGGRISYERGSIEVGEDIAQAVASGQGVVVVHGVDTDGDGRYGGAAMSDLDPSLPAEATDPAICGVLNASQMAAMPNGGVQTGGGSTAGVEHLGLLGAGGAALLAGGLLGGRRLAAARQR